MDEAGNYTPGDAERELERFARRASDPRLASADRYAAAVVKLAEALGAGRINQQTYDRAMRALDLMPKGKARDHDDANLQQLAHQALQKQQFGLKPTRDEHRALDRLQCDREEQDMQTLKLRIERERLRLQQIELLERINDSVSRERVCKLLAEFAAILRSCGEKLRERYGQAGDELLLEAIVELEKILVTIHFTHYQNIAAGD